MATPTEPHIQPSPPTSAAKHVVAAADRALVASGLGKRYDIYPSDRSRFFEFLGSRSHHREHWALRGFDIDVPRGQAIGVIGGNGAGKSSLLRVLAGITEPSEGTVRTFGRVAALLDLNVGFQEAFTGRENIELGCKLLGLSDAEITQRLPDIIRFAELGAFIDDPVRTYSTGMGLRLGFAIAVHVDAELLLVDEVLAVGDQGFQRKCIRRIEQMLANGCGLVLVSHDLHAIRSLCSEVIWLDAGRPRMRGPARDVVDAYLDLDRVRAARAKGTEPDAPAPISQAARLLPVGLSPTTESDPSLQTTVLQACDLPDAAVLYGSDAGEAPRVEDADGLRVSGTGEVRILKVALLDGAGVPRAELNTGDSLVVAVTFRTTEPVESPIFGVALFRNDGTYVYGPNTRYDGVLDAAFDGVYTVFVHYPKLPLLAGSYRISVAVYDKGHVRPMAWHNQLYELKIVQQVEDHGLVMLPHRWGMIVHHDGAAGGGEGI